jgi:hypothetical protein
MRRGFLHVCLLIGALSSTTITASAQQTVHALTGKITGIDPTGNTIQVTTDDGSHGVFDILTQKNVLIDFEKNVKAMTTPASSFTNANCDAVVYYFGDSITRTTVAVEDLGAGPLVKVLGNVVKFDKHAHLLTIKDSTGQVQSFLVDAKTVADSFAGVVLGQKFDPDKGQKVHITANTQNGVMTALFIRALSL